MYSLGILVSLLVLLYFSTRHNTQLVYHFLRLILRFDSLVYTLITLLFLPGTILHESAHLIMALVLLLRVREFSFMPQIKEQGIKLGYVTYEKKDKLRGLLVGVAPIFLGITALGAISYFDVFQINWIYSLLFGYLVFAISSTMFSSKQDMVDFIIVIPIMVFLGMLLFVFQSYIPTLLLEHTKVISSLLVTVTNMNKVLIIALLVQLVVMVVLRILIALIKR